MPFWSIEGTLSQVTIIIVGELTMTATLSGGLAGTELPKYYLHNNRAYYCLAHYVPFSKVVTVKSSL